MDQEAVATSIAELFPPARLRELVDTGGGVDLDVLRRGAELGWFGLGVADAAIVAEERGRALLPGPFVPTAVVAWALDAVGDVRAAELVAGRSFASWAAFGPTGVWDPGGGVTATTAADGAVTIDGARRLVPDAGFVDWLLVAASEGGEITQLLVPMDGPGVMATQLQALDLTRTLWEVRFDGVVLPASARLPGGDLLDRQLDLAVALSLAETVGTMAHLFEWTVSYAKQRTAFGRPIGSFQAMKHLLADTSRLLETSKAVAVAAARAVDVDPTTAGEVVSMAKSYVSGASIELAHACWQTFGGVAYTWDHDFHLHLRRLTSDAALYGDAAWHNERICTMHGL